MAEFLQATTNPPSLMATILYMHYVTEIIWIRDIFQRMPYVWRCVKETVRRMLNNNVV